GEHEKPIGGGEGGALLAECQAPRYVEKQAARGGGAHPERPSDREMPRTRDPYPACGDHDSSKIQGAADIEQPVHEEEPGAEEPVTHGPGALHERERRRRGARRREGRGPPRPRGPPAPGRRHRGPPLSPARRLPART